ncbi:MAG: hypothetical protein IH840_03530 [Candidatus Heimdallarchaeota archaeon]|nr:hypothetical protein [Candidatus Heimdallarchaeota archaeon]
MKLIRKLDLVRILLVIWLVGALFLTNKSPLTTVADHCDPNDDPGCDEHEDTGIPDEEMTDAVDDEEVEDPELDDREVLIQVTEKEASIFSESKNEIGKDAFEASISVSSDAELRLEYKSDSSSDEIITELKMSFSHIVEFLDGDSDGVYTEGNGIDTVVQTYQMADVGFDDLAYITNDLGAGITEHVITGMTSDGVFSFVVHIVGSFAHISGSELKPTALKIDIIINGFDYQEADSKLALYSFIESTDGSTGLNVVETTPDEADGGSSGEEGIVSDTDGSGAFYTWQTSAMVDGANSGVLSSFVESTSTEQKLYLNYEHGASIVHDPKLGINIVNADPSVSGDNGTTDKISRVLPDISYAALFGSTLLATLMFLGIPALIYRSKRGN